MPTVALPTVEIPGFADAVRRERTVRESAFSGGNELVAGVEVRPFSLRHLSWLEMARNGFVVPCVFESKDEMLAHAVQVLYLCRPQFRPPTSPRLSVWQMTRQSMAGSWFGARLLWRMDGDDVVREVEQWLGDAFMDAPAGSSEGQPAPSYAATQAYILDRFAEAGLPFTLNEVLDMPMKQLWQHWRLASRRLSDEKLTNPSDAVAVAHLARLSPHHG